MALIKVKQSWKDKGLQIVNGMQYLIMKSPEVIGY